MSYFRWHQYSVDLFCLRALHYRFVVVSSTKNCASHHCLLWLFSVSFESVTESASAQWSNSHGIKGVTVRVQFFSHFKMGNNRQQDIRLWFNHRRSEGFTDWADALRKWVYPAWSWHTLLDPTKIAFRLKTVCTLLFASVLWTFSFRAGFRQQASKKRTETAVSPWQQIREINILKNNEDAFGLGLTGTLNGKTNAKHTF